MRRWARPRAARTAGRWAASGWTRANLRASWNHDRFLLAGRGDGSQRLVRRRPLWQQAARRVRDGGGKEQRGGLGLVREVGLGERHALGRRQIGAGQVGAA